MKRFVVVIGLGFLTSACSSGSPSRPEETLGRSGQSLITKVVLDDDLGEVPRDSYVDRPAVASNGSVGLVVWCDYELGIVARRIDAAGATLGDPIVFAGECDDHPAVAWGAAGFAIAWAEIWDLDILFATIAPDGTVTNPRTIVAGGTGWQRWPALGFDGQNFLLAWYGEDGGNEVRSTRIAEDGTVLGPEQLIAASDGSSIDNPAIAFDGSQFLVAWAEQSATFARRVGTDGVAVGAPIEMSASSGAREGRGATYDGTDFLVATDTASVVTVNRISKSGQLGGSFGIGTTSSYAKPAIAAAHGKVLLTWNSGVSGVATLLAGTATAGTAALPGAVEGYSAVTPHAGGWLVAWQDQRGERSEQLRAAIVSTAAVATPAEGTLLTSSPSVQRAPVSTFEGNAWLVAWEHFRDGTERDLRAVRLDPAGVVSGSPFDLVVEARGQGTPLLTPSAASSLLSWKHQATNLELRATQFAPGQTTPVLTDTAIGSAEGFAAFDVAYDGAGTHLAVYHREPVGVGFDGSVEVVVLDATGSPVIPPATIATAYGPEVAVAWGGAHLVVWADQQAVHAARFTATGVRLDDPPIELAKPFWDFNYVDVAHGAGRFLAVWQEASAVGMALLDSSGNVVTQRTEDTGVGGDPSVTFDGTSFVVAWKEASQMDRVDEAVDTLAVARVTPDGIVSSVERTPLSSTGERRSLGISSDCRGRTLVTYHENRDDPWRTPRAVGWLFSAPYAGTSAAGCEPPAPIPTPEPDGGAAGSAGAAGSSGAGVGGSGAADSGTSGVGGASAGNGGESGGGNGPDVGLSPASDDGGCGCRTRSSHSNGAAWLVLLLAVAIAGWRRGSASS
jgi:MYXO-CTERM domain-containing protein